jgi:peptidoglycan/LPS O-acetylase OafA/YrhL
MANVSKASGGALPYWPAFDGLRALAFLAVLGVHALPSVFRGGGLGVDVFFVLSGFLITTILYREWEATGRLDLKRFYYRRVLRLFPAVVVLAGACCVVSMLFCPKEGVHEICKSACSTLLYYANWRVVWVGLQGHWLTSQWNVLMHTWSLSVEEQFYLAWPVLLAGLLRLKVGRRGLAAVLLLALGAGAAWRIYLYPSWGFFLYFRSDTHADGLLLGCLAALLYCWDLLPRRRWVRAALRAAAVVALLLLCYQSQIPLNMMRRSYYYGGSTLFGLETAVVLLGLLAGPPRALARVLEFPVLVWIGRLSYGLYLWHLPVLLTGTWVLGPYLSEKWALAAEVVVTFVVATLSFYAVERPFLRLKDRLHRRTGGTARPAEGAPARPQTGSLPSAA